MIVYRGSDVILDHEPPKWSFWTSSSAQQNYSFARRCEFVRETGNATGMFLYDSTVDFLY